MGYNCHPPCPEFPSACAPKPSNTACSRTRERPSPATSTLAIRKLSATPARPAPVAVIGFTNSSAASAAIATAPTAITSTAANAPSARAASPPPPSSDSTLPCSAGRSLRSPAAFLRRFSPTLLPNYREGSLFGFKSGKNAVRIPTAGKNEQTWYTKRMLVASASFPSSAAPIPPNPNASPKNVPDIVPTLLGTSSCANTRIVENADAKINPITTLKIPVQNKFAYGSINVNGNTPRIEYQITTLRPMRSPTGPPKNVPAATAPKNANK